MTRVVFNKSNSELGIEAMRHAAYFYYQLLNEEGEFNCGATCHWLYDGYTCWDLMDAKVENPKGIYLGLDEEFIRESAVIYGLCTLVNIFEESLPEDYPQYGDEKLNYLTKIGARTVPEVLKVVENCIPFNDKEFYNVLSDIFEKYVRGRFEKLL